MLPVQERANIARSEEDSVVARYRSLSVVLLLVPVVVAGCHVDTHKNGDNSDVNIGTPFGSMHVKTDDASTIAGLGLTPYPGATVVRKDGDSGTADVGITFGDFKLGVHAADLQTSDPEDKVVAFYRKDMGRYGAVIACRGRTSVGQPVRTSDGLTCSTDQQGTDDDELQLRAGSPLHQHIVAVREKDGGTRIGLVALDLPQGAKHHDEEDRE